jgi:transcriptional regulator with PAS, ATPase and Fis domain
LVARAIHQNGPRKERPFVTVNCGAFQDALLESELFGHRKGAFTDAVADKVGLFEVADGGTIFLDEISEMSAALQVKLLRVLQEGEIRRVGDTQLRHVDVRIISATNQDLIQAVRHKRFREDLYYRLNVLDIPIPPLRERREDIPLLVAHLIGRSKKSQDKSIRGIDQEALELLVHYPWPGNVRELENVIERAVALATSGKTLTAMYFPSHIADQQALRIPLPPGTGTLRQARAAFEREYIAEMPRQHQGNAVQTAKVLGISRQMLQKKIKDYGLQLR